MKKVSLKILQKVFTSVFVFGYVFSLAAPVFAGNKPVITFANGIESPAVSPDTVNIVVTDDNGNAKSNTFRYIFVSNPSLECTIYNPAWLLLNTLPQYSSGVSFPVTINNTNNHKYLCAFASDNESASWNSSHDVVAVTSQMHTDTTAPTGSININNDDLYTNTLNANLTLSASSDTTSMNVNGEGWVPFASSQAVSLTPGVDGSRTVSIMYKDSTGNISPTYSDDIQLDTSVNSVTANSLTTDNTTPTLTGTDSDILSGIASVTVTFNGTTSTVPATLNSDGTWNWNIPSPLSDGAYPFYATATDNVGNTLTSDTATLTILTDHQAPIVNVTSPIGLHKTVSNVTVTASDTSSGIGSVAMHIYRVNPDNSTTLLVGCTTIPTIFNGADWIADITNGGHCNLTADGTYQIAAWAYDNAGNPGWAPRVNFTLDSTAPSVPMNGLPNGTYTTTNNFDFTWDASTDASAITYEFQSSLNPAQVDGVLTTGLWKSGVLPTPMIHSSGAPDGTWYWQVRALDAAGNYSNWSTIWAVTLDTQAPATPVLVSPVDGAYVNGASVTNVWSETSTDVDHFVYESYHNEALTNPRWTGNFTTTSKTATSVADASFWWRVKAVDFAGNESTWSQAWKVTVDNIVPVTSFVSDISNSDFNSPIYIQGSSSDTNGLSAVNLYFRNSDLSSDWTLIDTINNTSELLPFTWSYTWTPTYNGTFDIKASGVDLAGNTEHSPMMINITYDTTLPTIGDVNIVVDYFSKYVNGRTGFLMFVPVSDSLSGIDSTSCMYTLDGSIWNNGTTVGNNCKFEVLSSQLFDNDGLEISARVKDNAGNSVVSNIVERRVDKALPTSQTVIDNIYYGPNSLPEIKGTATDTVSDVTNVALTLRRNSDGKYWMGGNTWWNVPALLALHGTSGTDSWTYTQGLPTFRNNVTYTVTPYAWDQVHLATQAGTSDSFIWDNELPQDPNSFRADPEANTPTSDNTIDVYFSGEYDSMSGVAGFYYSFSNTQETPDLTNWLPSGRFHAISNPLADGTWWFNIRTIDNAGNITSTSHYGPFIIDTTPATISWNSPADGSMHNSAVVLSATSNETMNNFRYLWKKLGDSSFTQGPNNNSQQTTYEYTFDPIEDGVYTLRAQGRDLAINWSKATPDIQITIDRTAPRTPDKLKFTNPNLLCGGITNSYTITAVWDDNGDNLSGVKEFIYSVDTPGIMGWTTRVSATQRPGQFNQGEGIYTFKVKAVDNAGNEGEWSNTCSVTYDTTAPDVEITSPTEQYVAGTVEIRGTVTDANPHHYWFVIENSSHVKVAGPGQVNDTNPFTDKLLLNWDTSSLPDGQYTIKLEARDSANNKDSGSVKWLVVNVDNTPPETTATGIDSLWHNTDVTVTLTCTDVDGSGCYKTYYSLNGGPKAEGNTVVVSSEGENIITFSSTDNAGNEEFMKTSDVIRIDKTNPIADVLSTLSFTTGDTTPRSLALSDNTELAQVCYVIDTNTQTCLPLFGTGYSWDITTLINTLSVGTHTFTYYVEDTAGNRSDYNTIVDGDDPYAASIIVAAVPQQAVRGAATVATPTAEAVQGVQTTEEEETTTPVTTPNTEEVKGTQDTNEEETSGKPIPWWVYAIGGTALLAFIIFLIARRRKEEEEEEKNIR